MLETATLSLEALDRQVGELCDAASPAEIFKILLETARLAAPRASIFLVRQGHVKGWGAVGYTADAARRIREHDAADADGWLGALVASERPLATYDSDGSFPDFGQQAASDRFGVPLRVKGRPIALLVLERREDELPWHPPVASLLVRVAGQRLDLDLLRRRAVKSGVASSPAGGAIEAKPADPATGATGLQPVATEREPGDETRGAIPAAELEAVQRYAKLVATDIRLYNEDAVVQGRAHGDLTDRLGDQLRRGRETFARRYGALGEEGLRLLHEAFVQVLAGGNADLIPRSALD